MVERLLPKQMTRVRFPSSALWINRNSTTGQAREVGSIPVSRSRNMKSKTMPHRQTSKTCQNCKIKFTIEPEDFEFYKKIDVPEPTWCSECRMKRGLYFKNESGLYKRKCDFSGKEIFSIFRSDSPFKVYSQDNWYSDKWDALEYGRDYDFNRPFFDQIRELMLEVPWFSNAARGLVNSDYSMQSSFLKNCYFVFVAGNSEDCAYCNSISYSNGCYDSYLLEKSELCYQGFMLINCYKTFFSSHCDDCQEVIFSHNCVGCSNCFGCVNLRHKKYHIFNKPYTKEEYHKKLKEFDIGSFKNIEQLNKKARDFWLNYPVKFMHGRKNVNVTGENIYNSKDVRESYMVKEGENLKNCYLTWYNVKDCYDYYAWGENSSLICELVSGGDGMNKVKFCWDCYPQCREIEYCMTCQSSSNLFACVGLRHKKYCILNKQYSKKEYNELVSKIKKHMNDMPYTDKQGRVYKHGEFFPIDFSPFGYNETVAHEYFPLTKEQALNKGYIWYDKPKSEYKATVTAKQLPDHIKDVDNNILKEVIECSSKNCFGSSVFRIIPQELKFYQKHNLPLPRFCPECRHQKRIKKRNPMKLHHRQCMNPSVDGSRSRCKTEFETTYASDRKEIVYCEKCYNKEVG